MGVILFTLQESPEVCFVKADKEFEIINERTMSKGWLLFITVVCLPHSSYSACCKSSFAYLEDVSSLLFLLSFFTELVL